MLSIGKLAIQLTTPLLLRKPCKLFSSVARVCQRQLGFLVIIKAVITQVRYDYVNSYQFDTSFLLIPRLCLCILELCGSEQNDVTNIVNNTLVYRMCTSGTLVAEDLVT